MTWETGPKNGTGIPGSSSASATNNLGDLRQVTGLLCSHPPLLTFLVCKGLWGRDSHLCGDCTVPNTAGLRSTIKACIYKYK